MKKLLSFAALLFVLLLAACSGNDQAESETEAQGEETETTEETEATEEAVEITIGAVSTPHAEILEEAEPLLEEKGITLNIETYQDYVLPNEDLESERLDVNYFQHMPYLEQQIADIGYDFTSVGNIHIEPMGLYSKDIESLDDIEDGTEIIMSRSIADHGRVLALVETAGLIKLDEDVDKVDATVDDIIDNPKNLTFSADVDPAFLPEIYDKETDAIVAINTNYAIDADLNPLEDSLIIEGDESPYANMIVVRTEDKDNEAFQTLVEVLQSEEIQNFILETYEGAVVPVGGNE